MMADLPEPTCPVTITRLCSAVFFLTSSQALDEKNHLLSSFQCSNKTVSSSDSEKEKLN